jgi:DNA repair exonuclease SbcCD nuclease subunit
LHAADLHLDSPFRGMAAVPPFIRGQLLKSTMQALNALVETAIQYRVDFVVISGDVYDHADRSLRAQIRFQKALEMLAAEGILAFVVHGNHDPLDGTQAGLDWPETVTFFGAEEVRKVPAYDREGRLLAYIYGISYPTAAVTQNLAKQFPAADPNVYSIGLLHCNVDGDPRHDNYAPCRKEDLLQCGIRYWALGHIHARRVIHEHPHIVYPGNVQGRHIRETGAKGCCIVDVGETGETRLSFVALDAIRWFDETVAIDGLLSEQDLRERLDKLLLDIKQSAEGRPAIVRVTFTGRGPLHAVLTREHTLLELAEELRDEQLERAGSEPWVWIESLRVNTGREIDVGGLLEQQSFLGDLLRFSRSLAKDEREFAEFSGRALAPLFSQPKWRELLLPLKEEEEREWLKAAEQLAIDLLFQDEE